MGNVQPVNGSGHPGGLPPGAGGHGSPNDPSNQQGGRPTYAGASGGGYIPPQAGHRTYAPVFGHSGSSTQQQQQHHQQQQQQDDADNMLRTASDASMTIMDGDPQLQYSTNAAAGGTVGQIENWLDDDTVPTVFRWEHGGRQVYITGTFNGWSRQIPMHRSGNDFTYIHNLKRGKHAFKFIVDDEWRFAPDQPTVADIEGRINNFIDVTDFKAYTGDKDFEKEKAAAHYGAAEPKDGEDAVPESSEDPKAPDKDGEVFSHNMPDVDDYTKEPPPLPPHLRHIILNKPPQLQDTAALPVPQHVALNHLYCTAIKDNMMVLGITQRFKTKFVTTVYYSPCASK
jgi:5'-AMP-activated protein kinase regulatory beta subunit